MVYGPDPENTRALCVCSVCLASRPALTTNWGVPYRDRISIHVILWKKSEFHLSYYQQIKLCWIIKAQITFRRGTSQHWCWLFSLLLTIQFWVIFAWSLRCRTGCVLTTFVLFWTFKRGYVLHTVECFFFLNFWHFLCKTIIYLFSFCLGNLPQFWFGQPKTLLSGWLLPLFMI